jgi:hypothetical protein
MPPANAESRSSGGRILLGPMYTVRSRSPAPLRASWATLEAKCIPAAISQGIIGRRRVAGGTPDVPAATTAGSGPAEQQKPLR